ncbi:MAG: hypothetical protein AB9907_01010 [Flexilinea sp.]
MTVNSFYIEQGLALIKASTLLEKRPGLLAMLDSELNPSKSETNE